MFSALQSNAADIYVKCTPMGHIGNYKTVRTPPGVPSESGGTIYTMNCDGDGDNCCDWLVVYNHGPQAISQSQVDEVVTLQIAQGNNSGQIYCDGSSGSYTIETIQNDQSGKSCFLWEVIYDANGNSYIQTMIVSTETN